jgi:hypothetical protein
VDEDGLADAFRTGSAEGVRAVYERYSGAVFTIALRVLGDRELAADAQIAQQLAMPIGTVKSRSHRAHRRLASMLGHLAEVAA